MKNLTDDEIQSMLESGEPVSRENPESAFYQQLFQALDQSPFCALPLAFASSVVRAVQARQNRNADRWVYALVILTCVLGGAGVFFSVTMMDSETALAFTQTILDHAGIGILTLVTPVALFLLDYLRFRKLVR